MCSVKTKCESKCQNELILKYHFSGNTSVYVFITEIIWLTFDAIIDVVERLLWRYSKCTTKFIFFLKIYLFFVNFFFCFIFQMRDTNESTNSRVLYFSIFSMCCLLGLATWQVLYLRKYFKSKKLIE